MTCGSGFSGPGLLPAIMRKASLAMVSSRRRTTKKVHHMSSFLRRGLLALGLLFAVSACGQTGDESVSTPAPDAAPKADPPVSTAPAEGQAKSSAIDEVEGSEALTRNGADEDMDDEVAVSAEDDEDSPAFVPPSPGSEDAETAPQKKVAIEKRNELTGNWFGVMSSGGVDLYMWVLEVDVSDDGDTRELKVVDVLDEMEEHSPPEVRELTATEAQFAFTFTNSGTELTLDYEGELHDGIVYGNVIIPGGGSNPMRLIPTKSTSLKGHDQPEETEPGRKVLTKVAESEDPFAAMRDFCKKYSKSPICLEVHKQLIAGAKDTGAEADVVKEIYNEYVEAAELWGPRMVYDARVEGALLLAFTGNLPEYALELFDDLEQSIPEGMEEMKAKIEVGRNKAQTEIALRDLESDDEAVKQAALETLQEFHDKNPFDPNLIYTMAKQMQKMDRTDEAIELYAELAALPMLENFLQIERGETAPSETLEALWNQKHGNTEGLAAYLNEVYDKRIHTFVEGQVESTSDGNKVHLVELFTGASCPPCVAADVATGGIEVAFSPSDVLVVRYHQHIPGPDPLSNEDSEGRLAYYPSIRGTPTTFLNGAVVEGLGGYLPQALGAYERLKQQVEAKLGESSDVGIELSTSGAGPEYTVSANVNGLPADAANLKLRIIVAEKEIHFVADNGVRVHEMVVRALLGGPDGIAISPDEPTVQQTVNVDQLKERLSMYLRAFEEGQDVEFAEKPLDLSGLQIVAFVQNDETLEILQTATIPLTGENQAEADTATGAE